MTSKNIGTRDLCVSVLRNLAVSISMAAVLVGPAQAAHPYRSNLRPVSVLASSRISIDTTNGQAEFPLELSGDWSQPEPQVTRAVIVIHGKLRNADVYFRTAEQARAAAGADPATTLLIAPQFLATLDIGGLDGAAQLLRWQGNGWMGGEAAVGAPAISSYAVLDAIAAKLADRHLFPNLAHVVFAGHSGGAQVVQRYAVATRGVAALERDGIDVRYVVSSPSSYAYFDTQRPAGQNKTAAFDGGGCSDFDNWKYGMAQRPDYLNDRTPAQLEAAYVRRPVTYLVGGDDDNPEQAALDKSCPAEVQGPQRVARGEAYFSYLRQRHPRDLNQTFHIVPGVGHNGARMLTSVCALATMFDTNGCER